MQKQMGGGGGAEMNPTKNTITTVSCGGNSLPLDNLGGLKLSQLRRKFAEVLNITAAHSVVTVNGHQVADENEHTLRGGEQVEFIKPAGQKG